MKKRNKEVDVGRIYSSGRGYIQKNYRERVLGGFDVEVGYAFSNKFTGYVGGYYFHDGVGSLTGPKAQVSYTYQRGEGRILGFIDGVRFEAGVQHDRARGFTGYAGVKLKIGLTAKDKNSNLKGFERHMVELVRRDPDIVTIQDMEQRHYQSEEYGYQFIPGNDGTEDEEYKSDGSKQACRYAR
jgi:hypothetical protein